MKVLVTEKDRQDVSRWCWRQVQGLPLSRADRKLVATKLEWEWWKKWEQQQAKED